MEFVKVLNTFYLLLGPKYCGWTPDSVLCDWIENSPILTFSDINKSILVGITSESNSCQTKSNNSTRSYFNFHPINSKKTMKWIADTIRSGEVCKWFYFENTYKPTKVNANSCTIDIKYLHVNTLWNYLPSYISMYQWI